MAHSKNLTLVSRTFDITHPNDPVGGDSVPRQTEYLRLDNMVSEIVGQHVRQGSNFRVVGLGCALTGNMNDALLADLDEGGAALVKFDWVSPTKTKVKAWSSFRKRWLRWRRMAGVSSRFDDFTVAFDVNHHVDGDNWESNFPFSEVVDAENMREYSLGDTPPCGLLNPSAEGIATDGYVGIFDEYQSRMGYTFTQKDSAGNILARSKYSAKPTQTTESLTMSCSLTPVSATVTSPPAEDEPYHITHGMEWLPSDNHVNVMCGLLRVNTWLLPLDTAGNIGDDLSLTITVAIEGWNELKD